MFHFAWIKNLSSAHMMDVLSALIIYLMLHFILFDNDFEIETIGLKFTLNQIL